MAGDIAEALQLRAEGGLLVQEWSGGRLRKRGGLRGPRQYVVIGNVEIGVGGDLIMAMMDGPVDRDQRNHARARQEASGGAETGIADFPKWKDAEAFGGARRRSGGIVLEAISPPGRRCYYLLVLVGPVCDIRMGEPGHAEARFAARRYDLLTSALRPGPPGRGIDCRSGGAALADEISSGISVVVVPGVADRTRGPGNLKVATVLCWLMTPPLLWLIRILYRRYDFPAWWAWVMVAALAINPYLQFSVRVC